MTVYRNTRTEQNKLGGDEFLVALGGRRLVLLVEFGVFRHVCSRAGGAGVTRPRGRRILRES